MSDDFKLSVDIEADLTKLDNTLNTAVQKTEVAGRRMQENLLLGAGASGMPLLPGTTFGIPGGGVGVGGGGFGGGGGGAGGGGGIPGGGGGGAFGGALRIGAIAYAAAKGNELLAANAHGMLELQNAIMAGGRGDRVAEAQYASGFEQVLRSVPILGTAFGATADTARYGSRVASNFFGGSETATGRALQRFGQDPAQSARTRLETEQLGIQANRGIFGGGYYGELEDMNYRYGTVLDRDIQRKRYAGDTDSDIADYVAEQGRNQAREHQEITIRRNVDMRTIKSGTTQANLRSFGAGGLANILGIQTQFQNEIEMTNPADVQRRGALASQRDAEIMSAIMSGMRPAEAFTPGALALGNGAIRAGSLRNQDADVTKGLMHVADKLGNFNPLVAR